ncbi:hypothetical protein [Methylomonas methanica]|uniref:PEP-CTERM sorting domain-containing protein n=1 Tax=Methylomonas methanica TaxID=421 RepID=A0A177MTH4_METMH|nr:hypothetical protein [Methylomonas methanica]OAI08139.1 hypothetical protein A1332_08155 [Methylomonas methanica]
MLLVKNLSTSFNFFSKKIAILFFVLNINIAHASAITVNIEHSDVLNWDPIQKISPGFGSNGPVSLNWDPYNDFFTELLAYDRGYSGGAAAFCWYGENCALQLSVTAENTALQLQSFDLGYYGYGNYVSYTVIDLATQSSILEESPWINGNIGTLITVNASSNKGFMILFGPDGFNGGINNITYSFYSTPVQAPVQTPIPKAAWLFGFGLVGLIGFTRSPKVQ